MQLGDFELVAGQGERGMRRRGEDLDPARAGRPGRGRATGGGNRIRAWWSGSVYVGSVDAGDREPRAPERIQALDPERRRAVPVPRGRRSSMHLPRDALRVLPAGEILENSGFTASPRDACR